MILCTKFGIYLQLTLTLTSERTITKLCLVTPYLAHSRLKRNSALIYGSSWPPAQASRKTFKFSKSLAPRVRIFSGWRISCKLYVGIFWRNKSMYNSDVLGSSWIWMCQIWNIFLLFLQAGSVEKKSIRNSKFCTSKLMCYKGHDKGKSKYSKILMLTQHFFKICQIFLRSLKFAVLAFYGSVSDLISMKTI